MFVRITSAAWSWLDGVCVASGSCASRHHCLYHTQVLFLSKNSLSSVHGLEQFAQVRVLSLADNLLAEWLEVSRLGSACPALEALSLDGNPLASMPSYRCGLEILTSPVLQAQYSTSTNHMQAVASST